jgi:ATP-dependent Clp protease ATP-binding subunit ClpC
VAFKSYGPPAQDVWTLAQEEARRLGHNYIGTEHLLLGLLAAREDAAGRALAALGLDLARTRALVAALVGAGGSAMVGEIGLTERTKQAIERAVAEARRQGASALDSTHLLLGLVGDATNLAVEVLAAQGVTPAQVRQAVARGRGPEAD